MFRRQRCHQLPALAVFRPMDAKTIEVGMITAARGIGTGTTGTIAITVVGEATTTEIDDDLEHQLAQTGQRLVDIAKPLS